MMKNTVFLLLGLFGCCLSGCGSHDFLREFPGGARLHNRSATHVIRAIEFTFDDDNINDRSTTGSVIVVFGDTDRSFEIPGRFTFRNIKNIVDATANVEITYQATEELKGKYRDLIERVKSKAAPDDDVLLSPDRLPNSQLFEAYPVLLPKGVELRLIDGYGDELNFGNN